MSLYKHFWDAAEAGGAELNGHRGLMQQETLIQLKLKSAERSTTEHTEYTEIRSPGSAAFPCIQCVPWSNIW
jgi:hypothetical protein